MNKTLDMQELVQLSSYFAGSTHSDSQFKWRFRTDPPGAASGRKFGWRRCKGGTGSGHCTREIHQTRGKPLKSKLGIRLAGTAVVALTGVSAIATQGATASSSLNSKNPFEGK